MERITTIKKIKFYNNEQMERITTIKKIKIYNNEQIERTATMKKSKLYYNIQIIYLLQSLKSTKKPISSLKPFNEGV